MFVRFKHSFNLEDWVSLCAALTVCSTLVKKVKQKDRTAGKMLGKPRVGEKGLSSKGDRKEGQSACLWPTWEPAQSCVSMLGLSSGLSPGALSRTWSETCLAIDWVALWVQRSSSISSYSELWSEMLIEVDMCGLCFA